MISLSSHMPYFRSFGFLILAFLCCTGCGNGPRKESGEGKHETTTTATDPQARLMLEAADLALKILRDREAGQSVDEVNQKYAEQIADIDARIAKLPKLTEAQEIELLQAHAGKLRDVETKYSALAEKGTLHETGKLLKLPNYALNKL
jgi:hypothetical protein